MFKNLKHHRDKKLLYIIIFLMVLSLNISISYLNKNQDSIITEKKEKIQFFLAQESDTTEWFVESHTEEWLENGDFEDDEEEWDLETEGDSSDVDADISDGEANYIIEGYEINNFVLISGTPNNTQTSPGWKLSLNPNYPKYPDEYKINESGCYASHWWGEQADQKVSVEWDKIITMPIDMSDYIITSASLQITVNATVEAYPSGFYEDEFPNPDNERCGIEVAGDFTNGADYDYDPIIPQFAVGDYIRFYCIFSNPKKDINNTVLSYQTTDLGSDDGQPKWDTLPNTVIEAEDEEELIFLMNQALKTDNRNFVITLGIFINCEDNFYHDHDFFNFTYINSCDLTFTCVKKINQLTSVSWEQVGEEISGRNIEITDAELNFDYKIDDDWPSASPNSEIRIYINDKEHSETIELSEAESSFEEASDDGFDVTDLIKKDKDIALAIQIFIADEFGLDHPITISIDDISLVISYDVLIPPEQSLLFQILFIIACVSAACIAGYLVYYQRVLKYPKPVRKVRKFRKTLKKIKMPDIPIVNRESAFNALYTAELGISVNLLHTKPLEKITTQNKIVKKAQGITPDRKNNKKSGENHGNKNFSFFIIILLLVGLFLNILMLPLNANQNKIAREEQIKVNFLAQESDTSEWFVESHEEEWLENRNFDDDEDWDSNIDGDVRDVEADISSGAANFKILGKKGEENWVETPSSVNWNRINNTDNMSLPDNYEFNETGWCAYHFWEEDENQSVVVQWQKNYTLGVDMSDYIITSASLEAWVNASVQATGASSGGIDRFEDAVDEIATGDYARFFILISDLQKIREYEAAYYQTTNLGNDTGPITELDDTELLAINEEILIFYLTQALKNDNRNFSITLGIRIWCEDNEPSDQDWWKFLCIKNVSLTFSYEKKIDQLTTVSWEQVGDEISGKNVEITDATLNFDYKVDNDWPSTSPNSEIRILINDKEHSETIKLSEAETSFEEANDDGFDLTDLISKNKDIILTIQVYIADDFRLSGERIVSIDDISLVISYDVLIPPEQSLLFQILFIIASVGAGCIGSYLVYYQRVLKYPKPVRKVRKYRRTLKKRRTPNVSIISRESAFKALYSAELSSTASILKGKILEKIEPEDKIVKKPLGI